MLNFYSAQFVDVNLGDLTAEAPAFLDHVSMGLAAGSFGQWHEGGFLVCSNVGSSECKHYSLTAGTW